MKRQRRTFTNQYKTETVKGILDGSIKKTELSRSANISIPLLDRWINDYVASSKLPRLMSSEIPRLMKFKERRKNYSTEQELKAKIAELYMLLDKEHKIFSTLGLTA